MYTSLFVPGLAIFRGKILVFCLNLLNLDISATVEETERVMVALATKEQAKSKIVSAIRNKNLDTRRMPVIILLPRKVLSMGTNGRGVAEC